MKSFLKYSLDFRYSDKEISLHNTSWSNLYISSDYIFLGLIGSKCQGLIHLSVSIWFRNNFICYKVILFVYKIKRWVVEKSVAWLMIKVYHFGQLILFFPTRKQFLNSGSNRCERTYQLSLLKVGNIKAGFQKNKTFQNLYLGDSTVNQLLLIFQKCLFLHFLWCEIDIFLIVFLILFFPGVTNNKKVIW